MNHTYEPPGLLPAGGRERTYALLIAGIPFLLILLLGVVPRMASGGSGGTSFDGGSLFGDGTPSFTDSPAPDDSTGYGATPSVPAFGDDGIDADQSPAETQSAEETEAAAGPAETVTRYYAAVNARDYWTAWQLGGKNLQDSYTSFVSGYATTAQDTVVIESVDGNSVSVSLLALLTDGTQTSYTGRYTVVDGVITDGSMTRTG
jgi:hypothetical protein